eukprot:962250-Prymnesium_polylepis.1
MRHRLSYPCGCIGGSTRCPLTRCVGRLFRIPCVRAVRIAAPKEVRQHDDRRARIQRVEGREELRMRVCVPVVHGEVEKDEIRVWRHERQQAGEHKPRSAATDRSIRQGMVGVRPCGVYVAHELEEEAGRPSRADLLPRVVAVAVGPTPAAPAATSGCGDATAQGYRVEPAAKRRTNRLGSGQRVCRHGTMFHIS